jgi:ribosome-associated protein
MNQASKTSAPESVAIAARILFALRADGVQLLDLRGKSDVADWYLVATCASPAQMGAILAELEKEYKARGVPTVGTEYKDGSKWAVMDVGEIMVHLFEEGRRVELALADLWEGTPVTALAEADFASPEPQPAPSGKKATDEELV